MKTQKYLIDFKLEFLNNDDNYLNGEFMKSFTIGLLSLLSFSVFSAEKCGKVEQLYYKAYPDMPQYSKVILGISGNNGNAMHIPDSAVPLATAAKVHGLTICYTTEQDQDGRSFVSEVRLP